MRSITTALVGALALVAGAGAVTFSLPSIAVPPAGMGDTDMKVNDGTGVVAINVNIQYQNAVATPGTPVLGAAATGFILESNDLEVDANTRELRVVVYQNPTESFVAGNNAVITIPWTAVGSEGESTPLSFSGSEGASDPNGETIASANFVGGELVILTALTPEDQMVGLEDLSTWVGFNLLAAPLSEPLDVPNNGVILTGQGTSTLTAQTTPDDVNDGVAGYASPADQWIWQTNSIYRIDWTAASTIGAGSARLVEARFKARDNANNTFAEMVLNSGGFSGLAENGDPRTFTMLFEPSDLTENVGDLGPVGALADQPLDGLRLDWDVVDLFPDQASTTSLVGVDVFRYDQSAVDALFAQEFAVTDFSDTSQWNATIPGNADADPQLEHFILPPSLWLPGTPGDIEINFLTTYLVDPAFVQLGTSLDTNALSNTGAPSVGEFGEAAIPGERVQVLDGTAYRQVMSIERLNNAGDPSPAADTSAQIKIRLSDQTFAYSVASYVEPVQTRDSDAAGVNRPVAGSSTDYRNYLVYPETADIQALQEAGQAGLISFLTLVDFNNFSDEGDIALRASSVESTPVNTLIP